MLGPFSTIGRTKKSHGNDGFLKLQLFEEEFEKLIMPGSNIFILQMGCHIPYKIKKCESHGSLLVKFKNFETPEALSALSSKDIFVLTSELNQGNITRNDAPDGEFDELIGYECILVEKPDFLGEIIRIEEFPQQTMAIVQYLNNEVLIPMNDVYIQSIDRIARKIKFELPEGLIDLND